VTLLYGTMYGNTERMMNAIAQGVASEGIPVEIFDVARTHSSYILPSLWTKSGVIIGAPTYEVSLFPAMKHILHEAGIKRITGKKALFFGSYGWSGGALKDAKGIIEPLKWELAETLEFQGAPTQEEMERGKKLGVQFARSLKG
jgi:flavorubredoxin